MPLTSPTPETLLDLLEGGRPGNIALQAPDGPSVTYDNLRRQVHDLGEQLRGLGIARDDRVLLALPNGIEAIVAFLAVSSVATAGPLNPGYRPEEFRFYMEDTHHKALITPVGGGEAARGVALEGVLQIGAEYDWTGTVTLTTSQSGGRASVEPPAPDNTALILHTSGTTSRPKRVPLRHRNLAASAVNIRDTYALTPEDVGLCVMPLFHVHGIVASLLATLLSGGTVLVQSRFSAARFWPTAKQYGVSWYTAVPSMHQALLARSASPAPAVPDALRFIRSCSSPLAADVMLAMEDRFGVPVLEAYGMTEAAHQMTSNPLPPGERLPGSVGPGTGVDVTIMDEQGRLLPEGDRGEVVIRGRNVIEGYEDNPQANADSFTGGWFRTGDEGTMDEHGYLTLTGRLKELINRSGEKISPWELDQVLMAHPAVAEAVCFAVPHPMHGEEPAAAVVLSGAATERDLIRHCRDLVAAFKAPRKIHILDQIPKTATGKVQRRLVAQALLGTDA